jgi:hypothetical protein
MTAQVIAARIIRAYALKTSSTGLIRNLVNSNFSSHMLTTF